MNRDPSDTWPDEMVRLLKDEHRPAREPTALDALAYVGATVAYYGALAVIAICFLGFWVATP